MKESKIARQAVAWQGFDENQNPLNVVKFLQPLTYLGIGFIVLFMLFCFSASLSANWQLIIPLALTGSMILYKQKNSAKGGEAVLCKVAYWSLIMMYVVKCGEMYYKTVVLESMADVLAGLL